MRLVLGGAVAVVLGVGVSTVVMQPSAAERFAMAVIFGLMALGTVAAAVWLPRLARGNRSLRTTFMALSIISFSIVVFGLLAAGQQMFISAHDLTLLLLVIGFGVVSAVAFAFLVSGPLTGELSQIAETATAIAKGDFSRRLGMVRSDEVGELADAVNDLATALGEAERMRTTEEAARRDLFAAIGHDLRTPLASLQVAIEAIQDGLSEDPERYLSSMRRDAEALGGLVDDLFLLARLESGDVEHLLAVVDVTELADETIELFRPLVDERGLTVRLEMTERVTAVASAEGVARVMRNLIDNAVRHSPPGGEIVVSISNGNRAVVEISDEGDGFGADFVSHAFDRFSRQGRHRARSQGGAGLGLAIAHGYVDDFRGEIWVEQGPGGKVGFALPVAINEPETRV